MNLFTNGHPLHWIVSAWLRRAFEMGEVAEKTRYLCPAHTFQNFLLPLWLLHDFDSDVETTQRRWKDREYRLRRVPIGSIRSWCRQLRVIVQRHEEAYHLEDLAVSETYLRPLLPGVELR